MAIENKVIKLSELITSSMKGPRKDYALQLLNSIIDKLNLDELVINKMNSNKMMIEHHKFETFIEKTVFCLQAIGFDKTELTNYDDDALIFIANHKHKFKKPLTVEYFNTMHQLYKYYEWTNDKKPSNLTDLNNTYTEIKNNRGE